MALFCFISANSGSFLGALRKSSRSLSHLLMSFCVLFASEWSGECWYKRVFCLRTNTFYLFTRIVVCIVYSIIVPFSIYFLPYFSILDAL